MATELVGLEFLRKNEIKNKTCDPTRPYAFISYSHDTRDAQIVMNVFNMLYNKGYNLWIDIANMPHDENAWSHCAIKALKNKNCSFAFFFRSESSMTKNTIAEELDIIRRLRHVSRIVTVDIWHDERNTADRYYNELYDEYLNGDEDSDVTMKYMACKHICSIVNTANSAIRLAADVQNNILKLSEFMEEDLEELGILPLVSGDGSDRGPEAAPAGEGRPEPRVLKPSTSVEQTEVKKKETSSPEAKKSVSTGEGTETVSLPAFLKEYNIKTFLKGTYQRFRLVGSGECAKYDTEFFDSAAPLTWSFVRKVLEERGQDYISLVVEKNTGKKHPPFITAKEHQDRLRRGDSMRYQKLDVQGLEDWSMCTNYSQYAWISDVLCRRISDMGLPLADFFLEYVPRQGAESSGDTGRDKPLPATKRNDSAEAEAPSGGIAGSVDVFGRTVKQKKWALEKDGYCFTLRGERYLGLKLKDMMLTVFKTTLVRHPEELDLLLESLPCLGEGIKISSDAHPSTFRAGDTIEINGRSISIGTSLNQAQVLKYMKRLMQLCGEPGENLVIDGYDC